jgi:hypothetical protein
MLDTRTIFDRDGLQIADVICRHERGKGAAEEAPMHGIGFVRRGCFVRNAEGDEAVLDPSTVFFVNPGEEQRYDHPHSGGDDCTALSLEADLVASIWGGDPALPKEPFHSSPELDLDHRLLLGDARRGADPDELGERAILLAASVLEHSDRTRAQSGRPGTSRARRLLVDGAREALAADLGFSDQSHLCRVIRSETGSTPAALRNALT